MASSDLFRSMAASVVLTGGLLGAPGLAGTARGELVFTRDG